MTVFDHLVAYLLVASSVASLRLPELILPGVSWSQHADEHPALQALSDNSTVQNSRPLIGILSQAWSSVRILSACACTLHMGLINAGACVQHCITAAASKEHLWLSWVALAASLDSSASSSVGLVPAGMLHLPRQELCQRR